MEYKKYKKIGLIVGLLLFFVILLMPTPEGLTVVGQKVLAVALLMVVWWGTEAVPIPITSLLPIVLFPLLSISGAKPDPDIGIVTFTYYSYPVIMLAIGIFLLAGAIVKWNLHKRISLSIIKLMGDKPSRIVLGFILATAFISMWMSNTTSTAMMIPIALALLMQIGADHNSSFGKCLILSIPFAATIGGIGTIIGTGTNITGVAVIKQLVDIEISFFEWFKIGLPFVIVILPLMWIFITKFFKIDEKESIDLKVINDEIKNLGKMSKGEILTLAVFITAVILWITRIFWKKMFPFIGDETISIIAGISLFIIPVNFKKGQFLLDIKTGMESVSWGTILLLGGAMTIGKAFAKSGITDWIAGGLGFLNGVPTIFIVIFIGVIVAFLTEVTTNMVVVAAFLPMLSALAVKLGVSPLLLMLTATVSASFAFMLPPATPPNAIAYGSGYIDIKDLVKVGFWLKLICLAVFPAIIYLITMGLFGIG